MVVVNMKQPSPVYILLGLDLLFFGAAVALSILHQAVATQAWEAFTGINGALLLILKADNPNPSQPPSGAQPSQKI